MPKCVPPAQPSRCAYLTPVSLTCGFLHRLAGVMADTMGMGHDDLNGDDFEDFEGTNVPERSPSSSEAAIDSTPRVVRHHGTMAGWQHCGRLACLRKYA